MIHKQVLKRWARIVNNLTMVEVTEILRDMETDYLGDWVATYNNGKLCSGSFEALARMPAFIRCNNWQALPCQFEGGPDGITAFTATLGTYVLDCLLQEIRRYGNMEVYSKVFAVLQRRGRVICLMT